MASYLRPRRGKKATAIAQLNASAPLKRGEVFFEVPDAGTGTGAGRIKMGDGSTAYESLPYFLEPFDPDSATVGFTNSTAAESDPYTTNATHANAIVPSANLKTIFTNLKQLLLNYNSQFTKLNNDLVDTNSNFNKFRPSINPNYSLYDSSTMNTIFYNFGGYNFAGIGTTSDGSPVLRRGITGNNGVETIFSTDGEIYNKGTRLAYYSEISNLQIQINDLITKLNNIDTYTVTPYSGKPYSGYTVYDTSYVNLNKFGVGDLYFHANVNLVTSDQWNTVGYIPVEVRPNDLRYLYCMVIGDNNGYHTLRSAIDTNGNIKVYVISNSDITLNKSRDILVFGSYCI